MGKQVRKTRPAQGKGGLGKRAVTQSTLGQWRKASVDARKGRSSGAQAPQTDAGALCQHREAGGLELCTEVFSRKQGRIQDTLTNSSFQEACLETKES